MSSSASHHEIWKSRWPALRAGVGHLRAMVMLCGASLVQPLAADLLDDSYVKPEEFALTFRFTHDHMGGVEMLQGIPFSDEHRDLFANSLEEPQRVQFFEGQGMYAEALELAKEPGVDRARLLMRLGRKEDARAALSPEAMQGLIGAEGQRSEFVVRSACVPLENTESWDLLAEFLPMLAEASDHPRWQMALWCEELDIAWHRELLPELLVKAQTGEPLRHAAFLSRLGESEQCDAVLEKLLVQAGAREVGKVLDLFPDSPLVKGLALKLWRSPELGMEERRVLWPVLDRLPKGDGFSSLFMNWLAGGGDAAPLADLIFENWFEQYVLSEDRQELLEVLQGKNPQEPRFAYLLARRLHRSDKVQAAKLYEIAAGQPFRAAENKVPHQWSTDGNPDLVPREAKSDLAFLGINGLGQLNRQDRVKEILQGRDDFHALPGADQARYLAAGRMDYLFFALVEALDLSLPVHDGFGAWLNRGWEARRSSRAIPATVPALIARHYAEVVIGSPAKDLSQVKSDAVFLLRRLGDSEVDVAEVKAAVLATLERAKGRGAEFENELHGALWNTAESLPRLVGVIPKGPRIKPAPRPAMVTRDAGFLRQKVAIFSPPSIRRVSNLLTEETRRLQPEEGGYVPAAMFRWTSVVRFSGDRANRQRFVSEIDKGVWRGLLRNFPTGHPRRIPAEVLIAAGVIETGDEGVAKEAVASAEAFASGKGEKNGTELFRYVYEARAGANKARLQAILDEVKVQPPAVRGKFLRAVAKGWENSGPDVELAKAALEGPLPVKQADSQGKDEDTVKLEVLAQNQFEAPEAAEIAKRVLAKGMLAPKDMPGQYILKAITVLHASKQHEAWVAETRQRMEGEGKTELEILRALAYADRDPEGVQSERSLGYALRILALVPNDRDAARIVMMAGVNAGDREKILMAAPMIGRDDFGSLASSRSLATLGKPGAARLMEVLRQMTDVVMDDAVAARLHAYFFKADAALAKSFREWLVERGSFQWSIRIRLVRQLLDSGLRDEAAETVARSYIGQSTYPGAPWAFPPAGAGEVSGFNVNEGDSYLLPFVKLLQERGILGEVLAHIDKLGIGGAEVVALRLVADPVPETYERYAGPPLAKMKNNERPGRDERAGILRYWSKLLESLPDVGAMRLVLAQESVKYGPAGGTRAQAYLIMAVAGIEGSPPIMAAAWAELSRLMEQAEEGERESAAEDARSVVGIMARFADDATWANYWKWRSSDPEPLKIGAPGMVTPARLREILPRSLREQKDAINDQNAMDWTFAALRSDSDDLIRGVGESLPGALLEPRKLCDLALGETSNLSPIVGTIPAENGETVIWWNFVSVDPVREDREEKEIPLLEFPKLNGKFDLRIAVGNDPEKMTVLETLESVAVSGQVVRKLPEGASYIALLAHQRGGGLSRWTEPVAFPGERGKVLPPAMLNLEDKGFLKTEAGGPGGFPAYRIPMAGRGEVDLLEIPPLEEMSLHFGAWIAGEGFLSLRCLDAGGLELQREILQMDENPIPTWQYRSHRWSMSRMPAGTVRVVLSAERARSGYSPGFLVSGLSLGGVPIGPLPQGFEKIAKVPAGAERVSISGDGRKLVTATIAGRISVVDLESGEGRTVPLDGLADAESPRAYADIRQLIWTPAGIYVLDAEMILHRIDPEGTRAEPVLILPLPQGDVSAFVASADGRWLARREKGDLVLRDMDATGKIRRIPIGAEFRLVMEGDGLRILVGSFRRMLLRAQDFEAGEPVEEIGVKEDRNRPWLDRLVLDKRQHPKWENRIALLQDGIPDDERGRRMIRIPVRDLKFLDIAEDGLLVYVSSGGDVVKVKPDSR